MRAGDESSEVEQLVGRFATRRRAQPREIDRQRPILGDEIANARFAERAEAAALRLGELAANAIQRGERVVTIAYRSRLAPVAPRAAAPRSRACRSLVSSRSSAALSLALILGKRRAKTRRDLRRNLCSPHRVSSDALRSLQRRADETPHR